MIIGFSTAMVVTLLFSCSKNAADIPKAADEEVTRAPGSDSDDNIIHAVPFETTVFVPCANDGAGEDVVLTGFTNFIEHLTWSDLKFTMVYHENVHQVTGVGVTSGEKFVASGGANGTVMGSWVDSKWVGSLVRQMRVIGKNSRFFVTYKTHLVVTPDGKVVVDSREQTAECK